MTKKKAKPSVDTVIIAKDLYAALILCHQELVTVYNHFGDRQNAYEASFALKLAKPFEDTLDEDASMAAQRNNNALNDKIPNNKKNRTKQIDKAIDLFYKANKDDMNHCFSRFRYLKQKEVCERVLEAVDEIGMVNDEAGLGDFFYEACGDELAFSEVIMSMEEDMNVQMPTDFTDAACKIPNLTIDEFAIILYKAGLK